MIIWGTRGLTSVIENRSFHCPQCSTQREGRLKQVRNFFTLYFIPLIPLNVAGRYAECGACGGTFAEEALTYDPEAERAQLNDTLLRVMILAALADGQVDDAERKEIQKQYMDIAGFPVPADKMNEEIGLAIQAKTDLNTYVKGLANDMSAQGRALIVKLAFYTMSASGDLAPGHQGQLAKLATTLSIPADQFRALIEHLSTAE